MKERPVLHYPDGKRFHPPDLELEDVPEPPPKAKVKNGQRERRSYFLYTRRHTS